MHQKLLSNNFTLPTSANAMKVTGKQVNRFGGYGLEILMTYSVLGSQKAIEWMKRHIARELEIIETVTLHDIDMPQVNKIFIFNINK